MLLQVQRQLGTKLVDSLKTVLFAVILWLVLFYLHSFHVSYSQRQKYLAEYQPSWPDYSRIPRKTENQLRAEERENLWRKAFWRNKDQVAFRYKFIDTRTNHQQTGKPFGIEVETLLNHRLPFRHFARSVTDPHPKYVFVTASSVGHVYETMDAVASVQRHFPESKVLYYDWGLKPWQSWDIRRWCNVELRKFNFTSYPVVDGLGKGNATRYQAAKVFAILDALQDYPTVIWMDASVRFLSGNISAAFKKAKENGGFVFLSVHAMHSTYAVTHPSTFAYLPSDSEKQKTKRHFESNALLISRTKPVFNEILFYWYLCSMTKDCIVPTLNVECGVKELHAQGRILDAWLSYLDCNRADQAVLNVLALNHFSFNISEYHQRLKLVVERKMTKRFDLKMCRGPLSTTLIAP